MIKEHLATNKKNPIWTMKFAPLVLQADLGRVTLIHSPNERLRDHETRS